MAKKRPTVKGVSRVEDALKLHAPIWKGREVPVRGPENTFDPPVRYYEWKSFWGRVQLTTDGEIYADSSDDYDSGDLGKIDSFVAHLTRHDQPPKINR